MRNLALLLLPLLFIFGCEAGKILTGPFERANLATEQARQATQLREQKINTANMQEAARIFKSIDPNDPNALQKNQMATRYVKRYLQLDDESIEMARTLSLGGAFQQTDGQISQPIYNPIRF